MYVYREEGLALNNKYKVLDGSTIFLWTPEAFPGPNLRFPTIYERQQYI